MPPDLSQADTHFVYLDDPDHPGWKRWELRDPTRFNAFLGPILTRIEDGKALVRMVPGREHSNLRDRPMAGRCSASWTSPCSPPRAALACSRQVAR